MNLAKLKRNLKKDVDDFMRISVGLLGDSPTQLLSIALKGYAIEEQIDVQLFEAEYNQIDFLVLNTSSELYEIKPSYLLISESSEKLIQKFYAASREDQLHFAEMQIDKLRQYLDTINNTFQCVVIYSNFMEINDSVFGNYSSKTNASFLRQIRKINIELENLTFEYKNLSINDLSSLQNQYGRNFTFSSSIYANTGIIHSTEVLPFIGKNYVDMIKASQGKIKKCLILDLDNTLWGGVIGDDGMEGIQIGNLGIGETFSRFQMWIKQLKNRGIILAVCSKNEEKAALEPFNIHPDMVLRLEDIAVFVANWDNKADNIRHIQSILNIGFDSMVFVDDNPVERQIVRDNIPEVTVPELPEDPAEYLSFLQNLNLFETASYSHGDSDRTRQYQEESLRVHKKKSFVNEDDFLKSLNMKAIVSSFQKNDIPRIAQLSQRSNQFNLRTIRFSEEDLTQIVRDDQFKTISFKLSDSYGDNGLVCIILLKKIENEAYLIHTWLMSCRVLKRGLEHLVLNEIVEQCNTAGATKIIGEYLPTSKNEMVKNHYLNLGFKTTNNDKQYALTISDYTKQIHSIEK
jgi:FkbH-like protein